jgi:hypothetical protein
MGTCFSCIDKTLVQTVPQFTPIEITQRKSAIIPLQDQPHLLDLTLCEVSVMTSHNSYIRTLQHLGESSISALQTVLDFGARCIELDIYRDKRTGGVFVAHGKEEVPDDIITTTKLDLSVALDYLSIKAFERTEDPLFIALELLVHNEQAACDRIADLLTTYFGARLFRGTLTGGTRLRDLVGKVVLLSGGGAAAPGRLSSMIHTQWSDIFQNVSSETAPETLRGGVGTCIRVYPAGTLAGALSLNFNPVPYLYNGATFVALNMCTRDEHMTMYTTWFANSSFVKKIVK